MSGYNITGTIIKIKPTQRITDRFSKREFVLETRDGDYTQTVQLEMHGQNANALDHMSKGTEVNAKFSLRGRIWLSPRREEKVLHSLVCYWIEPMSYRGD